MLRLVTVVVSLAGLALCATAEDSDVPFSGRARQLFESGKKEFEHGRWDEAEDFFKECKKDVGSKGSKTIKPWLKACRDGKKLDKLAKSKNARRALLQVQRLERSHRDSPLRKRVASVTKRIRNKIYHVLSNFEQTPQSEETECPLPGGADYTTDERYVKEGIRAAKWYAQPNWATAPSLCLGKVHENLLENCRYLSLWLYSPDKTLGKYLLVFNIKNVDVLDGDGDPAENCFFRYVTLNKVGWQRIRIDLTKDLSKYGNARLEDVQGLHLLMLPFSREKTIYVDDVVLEKK